MAVRHAGKQALPPRCSAVRAGHVGLGPVDRLRRSTVDENQATGINAALVTLPSRALSRHVGSLLLGGVQCFFYR